MPGITTSRKITSNGFSARQGERRLSVLHAFRFIKSRLQGADDNPARHEIIVHHQHVNRRIGGQVRFQSRHTQVIEQIHRGGHGGQRGRRGMLGILQHFS